MPPRQGQPQFQGGRPDQLWVADFTYVQTAMGTAHAAFVIDVFPRKIVGWRVSTLMTTSFVLDALNRAICQRRPAMGSLTRHSDRGMHCVSIRYENRLACYYRVKTPQKRRSRIPQSGGCEFVPGGGG